MNANVSDTGEGSSQAWAWAWARARGCVVWGWHLGVGTCFIIVSVNVCLWVGWVVGQVCASKRKALFYQQPPVKPNPSKSNPNSDN